jgi:hypothetical protein
LVAPEKTLGHGQHQGDGVLRDGLERRQRRGHHPDTAAGASVDVDIVEPDAVPRDDAEPGGLREQRVIDPPAGADHEAVDLMHKRPQRLSTMVGGNDDIRVPAEPAHRVGVNGFDEEDARPQTRYPARPDG